MPRGPFDDEPTVPRETPAVGALKLLVVGQRTSHALPVSGSCLIGRGAEADIRVQDESVSREHARVRIDHHGVSVEDLGSTNGTWVHARRLAAGESAALRLGEALRVGDVVLLLHHGIVLDRLAAPSLPADGMPVIGSTAMRALERTIQQVARGPISVLIVGETGAGKEVAARMVHHLSPRRDRNFVTVNCPALPESLIESELFGHARGAFTGADGPKVGLLESAHGGTVFLDEVGELPLGLQAKLLRVLEERRVQPVGGIKPVDIDVRYVAATNRDLEAAAAEGLFRRDLFFRLNGVMLEVPPLRERVEEVPLLARHFLDRYAAVLGQEPPSIAAAALDAMGAHDWPGNLRELRNVIERAALLCEGGVIGVDHLRITRTASPNAETQRGRLASAPDRPAALPGPASSPERLAGAVGDFERERIQRALDECAGSQTRAAELLGLSRRGLTKKLDRYGIPRPRKS